MSNRRGKPQSARFVRSFLAGASAVALCSAMALSAHAQDGEADDGEEEVVLDSVVVTGIRASLQDAQDIKRNADTFVDAITASDIGALPDRSVSEALQRVPGVSVIRFAGPNDPDHFAVEGSGVVIRGLPFVRSELNGRDVFGANSGGVLGFEDVSPELLGSVQVFKNQSADLIEGGIAGTIDLRTRVPFDHAGQLVSFSVEANYGDFREQVTPSASALYSNNWETDLGRFGILANASYNELKSRADGTQLANFRDVNGNFIPTGVSLRSQDFDRDRESYAAALQWESPDRKWLATAQFLRSDSTLQWGENVIETAADGSGDPANFDATDFVFDDDGVFESGTISDNSQWRGPNATAALLGATGGQQLNLFRERFEEDITNDFGFNLKFSPTENLRFNLDLQYIDSSAEIIDFTVHTSFFAPFRVDGAGGGVPGVSFLLPDGADAGYFQDLDNYFIRSALDHTTQNDAEEIAFRGDVEYDFSDGGWLKSVRAGVRYANQDTDLRQSDFNWGNVSEVWTGTQISNVANPTGDFNDTVSILQLSNPALAGLFGGFEFNNFQRGSLDDTGLGGFVPTYIGPSVDDFQGFQDVRALFSQLGGLRGSIACGGAYNPLTLRTDCTNGDQLVAGTPFLQSEIGQLERDNLALYTRVDFGTDSLFGSSIGVDGNAGVRYVRTDRTITAAQLLPAFDSLFNPDTVELCDPAILAMRPGQNRPGFCDLDLAALQGVFGDGNINIIPINVDYDEWLPSLNLRFDLNNGHFIRFAASRTLSRPGVDQLNQRPTVGLLPDTVTADGAGGEIRTFTGFQGSQSGNAALRPQTAFNLDLSYEWYFNDTGSVTLTGFYKSIDDFISFNPQSVIGPDGLPITIGGQAIQFNTEQNVDENGKLKGFEIGYQQFYDFLPGIFSGIGTQFNYTFIDADGVDPVVNTDLPLDDQPIPNFAVDFGVFPRVSRHNINAIGLYEYGPFQGRLAYNWRSTFQVTPRDVIFPFSTIQQPSTGQLDASVFYNINENWKVGLQGVNLLDDVTKTTQTINEDGLRGARSFFRNDRRFSVILRATF